MIRAFRLLLLAAACSLGVGCIGVGSLAAPAKPAPQTLRIYHIGNSITDMIDYDAFGALVSSTGNTYTFGRHMIPGAPLSWIWDHADSGFQAPPYGYYPTALQNYTWDVLTLEPFDRHLTGDDGDLTLSGRFIDMALKKSPDLRVYIYSRWPRKNNDGTLDFDQKWLRKYTGGWDNTEESRDYFQQVTLGLRQAYPALKDRIFLVPVGDTLYELNQRMKADKIPGYTDITQVYKDGIHFNNVGQYIVGCVFYATLYRQSPVGLTGAPYQVTDPVLIRAIQDAAWQVVRTNPLDGVS